MKPVIYVVANKGLNMSAGKLAAQVGHAVAGLFITLRGEAASVDWLRHPQRWMIVLEAEDEQHLLNVHRYLDERNVSNYLMLDEGVNEIRPFTYTALAVGVLDKDSEQAAYLSSLKKYRDHRYDDDEGMMTEREERAANGYRFWRKG